MALVVQQQLGIFWRWFNMNNVNEARIKDVVEYYYTHLPNVSWGQAMRKGWNYSQQVSQQPTKWKEQYGVKKLIAEYKRTLAGDGEIKDEDIITTLNEIRLGHKGKYITPNEDGTLTVDYSEITTADKKLIKEIQIDTVVRANGTKETKFRVIMLDALGATKMLAQIKGMFKEHVEVKGEVSLVERLQRGRAQVIDGPRGHEIEKAEALEELNGNA